MDWITDVKIQPVRWRRSRFDTWDYCCLCISTMMKIMVNVVDQSSPAVSHTSGLEGSHVTRVCVITYSLYDYCKKCQTATPSLSKGLDLS